MRKLWLASIALLAFVVQAEAQKYLNVYQDGLVIKKILSSDVDSVSLTDTEPYTINLWSKGRVLQSFASEEVDSIKVMDEMGGPLSYLGIIGFNDRIYHKNVSLLSPSTNSSFQSFINELPKSDGTVLYYAVDSALNVLEGANIRSQLSNINFVTFTDGLDQGSIMLNRDYSSANSYLQEVSSRIHQARYRGLPVNAYTIGLRGKDVTDVEQFKRNLVSLASSEQNAFEVSDMSEVRSRLQEIANRIVSVNTRQTVSVRIPGTDDGTRIRFTFDEKDAESSQYYIEGTLNLADNTLRDVTYHGIMARSGNVVQGMQDGIFLTFTFRGMRKAEGDEVLPTSMMRHYYLLPTASSWQINSEFRPENNTQRIMSYSGTLIILVLDCSSSLGYDFYTMQSYARDFVDRVARNAMPYTFQAPSSVQASADDYEFGINVTWDLVPGADYYQVFRSNSSWGSYELVADKVQSGWWMDRSPHADYNYYKVCAVGLGTTTSQSSYTTGVRISLSTPQGLKGEVASSAQQLGVRLDWDDVKYAEYYQVYRSSSYYYDYELVADHVNNSSWFDASPLSGSNYYKVVAVSHGITSNQSYYCEVCYQLDAPTNVKAERDSKSLNVLLSWDAVKNAQGYQVYRSSGSYSTYELLADTVTLTSWCDKSPQSGSNYYRVAAVGYGLTSAQSSTTSSVYCSVDAPTNVKATLGDSAYVTNLTWDAVKFADYYQVYRSPGLESSSEELLADHVTSCSWTDTSLRGNYYYYYYRLKAVGQGISSSFSSSAYVSLSLDNPKDIVAQLQLSADNSIVASVSWASVRHAEAYRVYRSSWSSSYFTLLADSLNTTSFVDSAPLSGSNYYRIQAIGHGTISDYATSSLVSNALSSPANVVGTLTLEGNSYVVKVAWDAVPFAESYQVYRSNSRWGSYSLLSSNVTTNSWTDASPLVGSNYYRVKASGHGLASGDSDPSAEVSLSLSAPSKVQAELALGADNNLVVNVTWEVERAAQRYTVYRSNSYSGSYVAVAENVTATSWSDSSPIVGSNYYKVQAFDHGLVSTQSSVSNEAKCALSTPSYVAGGLVPNGDALAIQVSWGEVPFAESYTIFRSSSSYGTFTQVAQGITSTSWKDESPLEGNNYYKVQAVGHGLSSQTSSSSGGTALSLSTPSNVTAQLVLTNDTLMATLTWNAVPFAKSYMVFRSNSRYGTYTQVADGLTSASWTDDSPQEGSNYYKVSATGYGLTSQQSNPSNEIRR